MTAVKCVSCKQYWTVATKTPELIGFSGVVCPNCIATLPRLDVHPIRRSA